MRYLRLLIATLAVAAGSVLAGPFEDGVAAANRQDYPTALRLWQPLARNGNVNAQFKLGFMYSHGLGLPLPHT